MKMFIVFYIFIFSYSFQISVPNNINQILTISSKVLEVKREGTIKRGEGRVKGLSSDPQED